MKNIYQLFPDVLNLNGDSANALVLHKTLNWLGEQSQIVSVTNDTDLNDLLELVKAATPGIFVVIGHGSIAGMSSLVAFDAQIRSLVQEMIKTGTPAIVVGSALKWTELNLSAKRDRASKFVVREVSAPGWPTEALGYVNSELAIEPVIVESNLIFTLLHGPFFAKNPAWVDKVLSLMGVEQTSCASRAAAQVHVDEIWRLEAND